MASTGDRGVVRRMFGTFLTWLNDHESDVFIVAPATTSPSCRRNSRGPSGLTAFSSWTCRVTRAADDLGDLYPRFRPGPGPALPHENWTGAEIRACCRLAALLDVPLVGRRRMSCRLPSRPRVGRATAAVGQRTVPVGRPAGDLLAGRRAHRRLGAERPPQRSVGHPS